MSLAIFNPHFVIRIFSSAFFHPHFIIRILSSAFYHPHFSIRILSSAIRHPPSAIRRHPVRTLQRPANCLTEFTELTRTPSRKYIYFWKAMINTAAKRNLVQLCYYITREFSSAFSRINRQTSETSILTEKCFKLAQKPCGRVVKRKYNLNGINTALRRALSMKTLRLF